MDRSASLCASIAFEVLEEASGGAGMPMPCLGGKRGSVENLAVRADNAKLQIEARRSEHNRTARANGLHIWGEFDHSIPVGLDKREARIASGARRVSCELDVRARLLSLGR